MAAKVEKSSDEKLMSEMSTDTFQVIGIKRDRSETRITVKAKSLDVMQDGARNFAYEQRHLLNMPNAGVQASGGCKPIIEDGKNQGFTCDYVFVNGI